MNTIGRRHIGLLAWISTAFCGAALVASPPATTPATLPPPTTTAPAAVTAASAAKKPSVDELLAFRPKAHLRFQGEPIPSVLSSIARTYDFDLVIADDYKLAGIVTMDFDNMSARDALNSINGTIVALGYTFVESVRGQPPRVVVTIVPTRTDAGTVIPVFHGSDPEQIPEGGDLRTQIMPFNKTEPEKLQTFLTAMVAKDVKIAINPGNKTVTITDTSTHVRAAAKLLQLLESQAPEGK
jgi:type II secretory pathway component GspD/PulD (secretin)